MRFNKYSYTRPCSSFLPSCLCAREWMELGGLVSSHWKSITRMHNVQNLFETPYGCYGVVGA